MCAAPVASRCDSPSGWEGPSESTSSAPLLVDDGGGLDERQFFGRQRERHVTERRQRAGAIGRQLADGVVVGIGRRPARIDVSVLLVISHADIVAGASAAGEAGRLLYAGQR
jgi:hypothetical protein